MSMPPLREMDLRDHFAGQCLASFYADVSKLDNVTNDGIARECYSMAQAMLKERYRRLTLEYEDYFAKIRESEK